MVALLELELGEWRTYACAPRVRLCFWARDYMHQLEGLREDMATHDRVGIAMYIYGLLEGFYGSPRFAVGFGR